MADEPEVIEPVVEPVEPVAEPTPEPTPHPLAEGGARFNEVYARMKQAEERAARMEGMLAAQQRPQQPQVQYTPEQVADYLQQQVDRGAITPMQAANTLSQFNAQRTAMATATQVEQYRAANMVQQEAAAEVNAYIAKVPALNDTNSAEFQKVSQAAYKVSRRMGLPVTDFRVQQTALESVYGSLDRIASNGQARSQSREASLPHTESTVGGTGRPAPTKGDDALKGVSQKYIDFWTRKGYSRERMVEEAKYVTKEPRSVPVNRS